MKSGAFQKYDPVAATWTPLNPLSFPLGQTFTSNGKGYSLLGLDSLYNFTPELYEYDPVSDSWTQKATFPGVNRDWARSFSIAEMGYVVGGVDVNYSQTPEFWQYDPSSNLWMQKADYPGYVDASDGFFSEELYGKGYVGLGGVQTIGADDKIYCYDPANDSWSMIAHPLGTRNETVAFVVNNALYVGRGSSRMSMDFSFAYNDFWQLADTLAASLSENPESNPTTVLFPNPTADFINVSLTGSSEILIYNSSGEIVYSEKINKSNGETVSINISSLSSGIYFLKTYGKTNSIERFAVIKN
jgi:N-acetylneuraminic acid mutarotase